MYTLPSLYDAFLLFFPFVYITIDIDTCCYIWCSDDQKSINQYLFPLVLTALGST